jgi:hypothetical protein
VLIDSAKFYTGVPHTNPGFFTESASELTAGYRLDTPSARAFLAHYVSLP